MTRRIESFEDGRRSRRRGSGGRAAAVSHAFVAAAGSARAEGVDLWDERLSVAASISGRPRACLNSRQAMISPTASPISCPAPDPPRRDVTPRDSITRYPDDFTQVAARRQQRAADGHRPRADRLWLSVWCDTSCTPDIRHAGSTDRASHPIASGTRGGRSDGAGLGWSGCDPLAGCSGVVGHRLPQTAAAIRDRESTRHAYALPNYVRSASWSPSPPVPLVGPREKEEG